MGEENRSRELEQEIAARTRELEESNRRNKIFVTQAPNAIAMFDTGMKYLAASAQWLKDYKLENQDIIGRSHYEVFPEIGEDWKQIHRECLQGAINQTDGSLFHRADGTEQWLQWDVRPWYIADGEIGGLLMYTADITERKNTERQLLLSEQRFRRAFEHSATGMAIVSLQGKWIEVNNTICKIVGYTPRELMNSTFQDITYPDDLDADIELVNELIEGRKDHYVLEKRYIHKDRHIVWVILSVSIVRDEKRRPLYFISQVTDITSQKVAQEKLEYTLDRLESLLDASTEVGFISTTPEGIITGFNRGAENMLGYSKGEMIDKSTPAIIHVEEEVKQRGEELSQLLGKKVEGFDVFTELAKDQRYETREWTYVRKDGTQFPVQLTVTAVKEKGGIVGYLGVATNISEIKAVEREVKSLLEVTKDQNERLKNFAHIVSHNLRSHAGNLSALLDLFLQENPEMEQNEMVQLQRQAFNNLQETISHLNEIVLINTTVSDILQPLNLYRHITQTINSVVAIANEAEVQIINEVAEDVEVSGVSAYLDSVLLNVITNGIKYRSVERDSFIKLNAEIRDGYVILSIADNGLGMEMKLVQHKLFGMYKTFHGNPDARGIGLFITKNQVEAMGGKIEVESEEGKGTTFYIYFKHEKN
jgi:PAS domain S-box-containing protein